MTHATATRAEPYEEVGPLFGRTNTLTRPARPTATTLAPVDEDQVAVARRHLGDRSKIHDLVVHGVRLRLFTNSHHLALFAREHFWSASEWRAETASPPGGPPAAVLYAVTGVERHATEARYDPKTRLGLVVNSAHFGTLRAMVLAAAGRILEEEQGILTLEGAAVGLGDPAAILTGADDAGRSALAQALVRREGARFLSDGMVHVRFMVPATLGRWVHPLAPPAGERVRVLRIDHQVEELPAKDVSLAEPPLPMAYAGEKVPYVPTALGLDEELAAAKLENVPAAGPAAEPEARGLLDVRGRLGPEGACTHPLEPTAVGCLLRLRRDPADRTIAATLGPDAAAGALEKRLAGCVPVHGLNLVRPPGVTARLVARLLRHPPERLSITVDSLEGYLR